jgi:hypothetical protein
LITNQLIPLSLRHEDVEGVTEGEQEGGDIAMQLLLDVENEAKSLSPSWNTVQVFLSYNYIYLYI